MDTKYEIIPKTNNLPDYSNKRIEMFAKFGANLCYYTKEMILGYDDVKLKGLNNIENIISENSGGLIIPNHVEYGDTIAIGTEFYKQLGIIPYFVQNSSLPFQPILRMLGGITFERGKDLKKRIKLIYKKEEEENQKRVLEEKIKHNLRQKATYDAVNYTIENSNFVTIYLQGGRRPNKKTNITKSLYQKGLRNWLNCLGHQPKPIIPLNISHEHNQDYSNDLEGKKVVHLDISEPIMHTEGIEVITQHLINNIDVFVSE